MTQATVLYDFDGIVENGEIQLREGEVVNVSDMNVGDGWWEGVAPSGAKGLFPESYVSINQNGAATTVTDAPRYDEPPGNNLLQTGGHGGYGGSAGALQKTDNLDDDDRWSEDWDDGVSEASTMQPDQFTRRATVSGTSYRDTSSLNSVENRSVKVSGPVGKNFNRFSSFVKHGGESYILGKADARVRQVDQVHIFESNSELCWQESSNRFTCTIEDPKVQSKLKGLKSFVAYKLSPSDTEVTVDRRYKHFDWLYERLVQRYPMITIPKLPEKQSQGRFEEDFIESRMARLKIWVSYICRHPVLSQSALFRNYITVTEPKAWKFAKRKAEKDELLGANFFLTVDVPMTQSLPLQDADSKLEQFKRFSKAMDEGVSQLTHTSRELVGKHQGTFKKEFHGFGRAFNTVSTAFKQHQTPESITLTEAMKVTGQTYEKISQLFECQPKNDLHPLVYQLWLYKQLIDTFPDIWHMQTGAMRKVKDCQKSSEEGKMTPNDVIAVKDRAHIISSCMQAEISHFHNERVRNFKHMMTNFLDQQIDFYEGIAGQLRVARSQFDEIPDIP